MPRTGSPSGSSRTSLPGKPGRAPLRAAPPFALDPLRRSRGLYATAHGLLEAFLSGAGRRPRADARVHELRSPLHVQTYDVTDLLVHGANVLDGGAERRLVPGPHGHRADADSYGDTLAFLGQLHVGDAVVATEGRWTSTTGPIRRRRPHGRPGRGPTARARRCGTRSPSPTTASRSSPSRRRHRCAAVAGAAAGRVRRLAPGRQVVDLGQNINGWVRLSDLGPAGTELTLIHGEALDADGRRHASSTSPCDADGEPLRSARSTAWSRPGRAGDVFEPRHTIHGFQYVRVEGHPDRSAPDDVTGVVVHTDLRRTGWFRCSDERINRLHEAAVWSFRDNACDIPTDCPHRERSGWTGDWQVFVPERGLPLRRRRASRQVAPRPRGRAAARRPACPTTPPIPRRAEALDNDDRPVRSRARPAGATPSSSSRGSCTGVYGDDDVLAELWPTMVRLARLRRAAGPDEPPPRGPSAGRSPRRTRRSSGTPASTGASGCEPGGPASRGGQPTRATSPPPSSTTPPRSWPGSAGCSGTTTTPTRYGELARPRARRLASRVRRRRRIAHAGHPGQPRPRPRLRPRARRAARARPPTRLVELIRAGRDPPRHRLPRHAATSSPCSPTPATSTSPTSCSSRTLRRRGWRWSIAARPRSGRPGTASTRTASPHASLNHYSKGAVISFLHRYVAGIQPARRRSGVPALPDRAAAGRRDHLGGGACTTRPTAGSSPRGASTRAVPPDRRRAAGHDGGGAPRPTGTRQERRRAIGCPTTCSLSAPAPAASRSHW